MSKHAHSPELTPTAGRQHPRRRLLGGHAIRAGRHSNQDHSITVAEQEAAHWRAINAEVSESQARVKDLIGTFENGLNKLVDQGQYDPLVLRRMSYVRVLTRVFEGNPYDHPDLKWALGYTDKIGGHVTMRDVGDKETAMHELGHRLLKMGLSGRNVFDEPIIEGVTHAIGEVVSLGGTSIEAYPSHARVLQRVLDASGLTFKDATRIASGDDAAQNFEHFRSEVSAGAGWDVAGFAQSGYERYMDHYMGYYPDQRGNAMNYAARLVDQDLNAYFPSVQPQYAA